MNQAPAHVGHVLSGRPVPPGLSRAGQAQVWTVLLGIALLAAFVFVMFGQGPVEAVAVVLFACLFLATMMLLEIGLAVVILAMLLSPEFSVGSLGVRDLTMRLQDIMIPILILAWLGRKTLGIDRRSLRVDPLFGAMFGFTVVQVFSSYVGWERGRVQPLAGGFFILKQIEFFAMCAFVAQYVHTLRRARNFIVIAISTAVVVACYGLVQIPGSEVWTRNRVTAPFEGSPEPSTLGGYFVLILGFVLALALKAPERRTRLRLLFIAGLLLVPMLYTLSRTSYVAFLVVLVMLAVLTRSRPLVIVICVCLLASPLILPDEVIARVMYTFNDHTKVFGVFDRSFGERLFVWKRVAWTMRQLPLHGGGVSYRHVIDSYYARVLIETGVLGLLAFTLIVIRLYVIAIRVRRRHENWWAQAFAVGYIAVLTGMLFHGFSAITFVIIRIMEPFWAATGVLLGLYLSLDDASSAAPTVDIATDDRRLAATTPDITDRRAWSNG